MAQTPLPCPPRPLFQTLHSVLMTLNVGLNFYMDLVLFCFLITEVIAAPKSKIKTSLNSAIKCSMSNWLLPCQGPAHSPLLALTV